MAISLKHNFTSAVADEGDTSLVRPSNWNAEHDLTLATSRLVGRTSAGTGSAEEISVGTGLNLSSGSLSVGSTTPQVNSINTFTAAQVIDVNDNSNPALRITQTGTADALRIEDEASPDATPFVITANGHAVAGYGSALAIETVVPQFQSHTATLDEGGFGGVDWGNTATGQVNWFGKSRGGSYGTQAIVQNNDTIGDFRFYGSDGVALIQAARIEVDVDGTPGVNDMPGRIGFFTTPDGATVPTEKMRIASDGTVTITGTGVINAASANDGLRITQTGSGNALVVEDSTNPDSTPFIVKADGKVGIGEDAPSFPLQVAAPNASTQIQMGLTSTNYTSDFKSVYLQYSDASTTGTTYGITNAGLGSLLFQNTSNALIGTNGGTPLIFGTTSLERMRLDSSGRLSIGTTNTGGSKLTIQDSSILVRTDGDILKVNDVADSTYWFRLSRSSSDFEIANRQAGSIKLMTSDIERMRITSAGDVGIGTASPGKKLDVNGDAVLPNNGILNFYDAGGVARNSLQFLSGELRHGGAGAGMASQTFYTGGTERFRIADQGQLGIGGTNYGTSGQTIVSGGASAAPSWGTLGIAGGGTGQTTASAAANALDGYLEIVASAGTTTLTNTSARNIVVTGSTSHTIRMPDVTTLSLGWTFTITNLASSTVTLQSSGANNFVNPIGVSGSVRLVCIAVTGTGTASWSLQFTGANNRSGSGNLVFSSNAALTTPTIAQISGGSAASSTLTLQSTSGAGTTDAIILRTGSQSERFRIDTSGALGIGGANYGTSGQVLTSGGSGAAPSWTTPSSGGGAADGIFWENNQTITTNYTVTTSKNAGTFGPVTINSGVTVTVPSGSTWTIV